MTENKKSGTYPWGKTNHDREDEMLMEGLEGVFMDAKMGRMVFDILDRHFYGEKRGILTEDQWTEINRIVEMTVLGLVD